jgi:methionine aminotransferase
MQLFRQVYQFANFCGVTPVQVALAEFMLKHPEHIQGLNAFYQQKRDLFNAGLANSRFIFRPSQGTYFQNLDYSHIQPNLDDVAMCQWLAHQHGIVAIPISVFYQQAPQDLRLIRFCFAKQDQTLQQAATILSRC